MLNSKPTDLVTATTSKDPDELRKSKRKRPLHPTIRFSLSIEKPSSETFTEFNYNKLVLKTLVRTFLDKCSLKSLNLTKSVSTLRNTCIKIRRS